MYIDIVKLMLIYNKLEVIKKFKYFMFIHFENVFVD